MKSFQLKIDEPKLLKQGEPGDQVWEAKAQFKHALLYGGTENADILDHYAEVLFKLGEHDLAFIYWNQAKNLDNTLGIEEKIKARKAQLKK